MDSRILLVGNLPKSATGDALYTLFGRCGPLRQVRMGAEGSIKSYAIVIFEREADAVSAVESFNGKPFGANRVLTVGVLDPAKLRKTIDSKRRQEERKREYKEQVTGGAN